MIARLESLVQDLRFGLRLLGKSPGLTATACLSVTLGLGGTAAMFSLMNALLFKPLPVSEPERLAVLLQDGDINSFSYPNFAHLQTEGKQVADFFAFSSGQAHIRLGDLDRKISLEFVSGNFFRVLRLKPVIGRLLETADDQRGSSRANAAVISYRFWKSAFNGDKRVVGRKILVDSLPFVVAGVEPGKFFGVEPGQYSDVVASVAPAPLFHPTIQILDRAQSARLQVMGRLQRGM